MIMNGDRENLFGVILTDHVVVKNFANLLGSWIRRSISLARMCLSSLMMSMHSSTHSSQTNTVGPAMSLRTSGRLLPQNEQ